MVETIIGFNCTKIVRRAVKLFDSYSTSIIVIVEGNDWKELIVLIVAKWDKIVYKL